MRPPRLLLFPTDYSPCADRAFAHAAFLSARTGAEIRVLHAVVPGAPRADVPAGPHAYASPSGAPLRVEERAGDHAAEVIAAYAAGHGVDLVVMGTHARRGPAHAVLGSTAERVVRLAPCPVLTVGPRAADPAEGAVRRLLVPVDFSVSTPGLLAYAAGLAALYGARVDVLHALDVPTLPDTYGVGLVWPGWGPEVEERSRAALAELAERRIPEAHRGAVHVEVGDPASATLDACGRLGADLVVMGTHGRTGLARFALGSTAERVVQRAGCPVLVVKGAAGAAPAAAPEPMLPLRRILVPVDFSRASEAALHRAADLARRTGAELHLLHVLPGFDPAVGPDGALEALADAVAGDGPRPHCVVGAGVPAAVALAYAAEVGADLVVTGTHGRRGAQRLLLGSVAAEVLRRAPVPVLVVPQGASARPLLHVLFPTDFSAAARLALPVAAGVADLYGATLRLLHVCEPPGAPVARGPGPRARAAQATLAAEAAPRRAVREVVEGRPAEAVTAFAEAHGVDLIVLARHERGAFGRLLHGSVTEAVARRAPCALLAVPVDERAP